MVLWEEREGGREGWRVGGREGREGRRERGKGEFDMLGYTSHTHIHTHIHTCTHRIGTISPTPIPPTPISPTNQ